MTALMMDSRMKADTALGDFRMLLDTAEQVANRVTDPMAPPVDPATNPKLLALKGLLERQVVELKQLTADLFTEFGGVEGFIAGLESHELDMNPAIKSHIQSATSLTFDGLDNFMPRHLDFIANARREMMPPVPMDLTITHCPCITYGNLMSLDGTEIHLDFTPAPMDVPPVD